MISDKRHNYYVIILLILIKIQINSVYNKKIHNILTFNDISFLLSLWF